VAKADASAARLAPSATISAARAIEIDLLAQVADSIAAPFALAAASNCILSKFICRARRAAQAAKAMTLATLLIGALPSLQATLQGLVLAKIGSDGEQRWSP